MAAETMKRVNSVIEDLTGTATHGGQILRAPATLDARAVEALSLDGRLCELEAGRRVLERGDGDDGAGLLLSGLLYHQRAGADGHRQILNAILPGEVLPCDVIGRSGHALAAATPVNLLLVPRPAWERLLHLHPGLRKAAERSRQAQLDRLRSLAGTLLRHTSRARLAAFLDLASGWVPVEPLSRGGYVLTLPLDGADLADLLGMSPVAVDGAMLDLRTEGLIRLEGAGRITITRPNALRSAAAMRRPSP